MPPTKSHTDSGARYLLGSQLDGVMNYPLGSSILAFVRNGGGQELARTVWTLMENYPPQTVAVLMNSLSTHDIPRAITALAGEPFSGQDREWQAARHFLPPDRYQSGKKKLRLASLLQYFLPGVPCLYYGDEAGLSRPIGTRLTVVLIPGGRKIPNCWTGSGAGRTAPGIFFPAGERGLSSRAVEPGFVLLCAPTRQPYAAGRRQPG